jgi:DNA-binding transcriptional ArsR family regulator
MAESREDEIYSIMFSSLKHPVRRKILRMLGHKPMTFMTMVEELGVSTPQLTYHLESLGDLVSKTDSNEYKLSTFGLATVNAMKTVEEVHQEEPKSRLVTSKWKIVSVLLMIAVLALASMTSLQYASIEQLSSSKQALSAENQHLLSYGMGADKVANFLQNITEIDTKNYTISLLSNTMQWRSDFGGVPEEVIQYSLTNSLSNLNIDFRFRNNHFSRYQLNMIESSPLYVQPQPKDVLQNAKGILERYQEYSGDGYLTDMRSLLNNVTATNGAWAIEGNMKLQISVSGGFTVFSWMHTQDGIDYQAKGLQMTFQGNVLTTMTDGYFLFTIGSTSLTVNQKQAVNIASNYVKTLTWTIEGKQVSGFNVANQPALSIQLVPHTRGESVALIPYWYVELRLDKIYAGGINEVAVGIYADNGQVADVQMLSANTET